ncbi:MAG: hypothetical protein HY308_17450 [Gammaproteobacteria bacterium]|nr:hypothetical protein [Gammaproteobacteria bacterium]
MSDNETAISVLCDKISRYLSDHPLAVDSVNGIARWWLGNPAVAIDPWLIQAALNELIKQQRIACRVQRDGTVLYFSIAGNNPGQM